MSDFSHLNDKGQAQMVDISDKQVTKRVAIAQALIFLDDNILEKILDGDIQTKKGSVIHTAIIAGTMAVKKTSDLIPLCHQLPLESIKFDISWNESQSLVVQCEVSTTSKTGVEMEALTGASVASLTIYDMCKAISHNIIIQEIKLLMKKGGKSDLELQS
jgi:cyclic pyranopterin monophosphate synthase